MEWHDEGLIIGGRRHGETSVILEVMTRAHGRHLGLVKGGRGKRMQPLLQPGNSVEVTWRGRLEEHLGFFAVETLRLRAADLMRAPLGLQGLNLVATLLRLLAEREPHAALFAAALALLDAIEAPGAAPALVRFEAMILAESGFGLDLECCAATGTREDLVYVSPKSGRAVSAAAGAPYRERLLRLPAFLRHDAPDRGEATSEDIRAGFALTGFFLERDIFTPRGQPLPDARDAYIAQLRRADIGGDEP
jgi:DNA repair protein RecO (recombination protein O)